MRNEMVELNRGGAPTVNPFTCDVVAFDECENRPVGYMILRERAGIASAMCTKMNEMQRFWNRKDGVSLFSGRPIVWQFQDTDDPFWYDPKSSGLPVFGVNVWNGGDVPRRYLVRAVDGTLAARIALCRAAQFDRYWARCWRYTVVFRDDEGHDSPTTSGIEWLGGPGLPLLKTFPDTY